MIFSRILSFGFSQDLLTVRKIYHPQAFPFDSDLKETFFKNMHA